MHVNVYGKQKRAPSVLEYLSLYGNISFDKKSTFHHKKGHFWTFEKIWGGCAPPPSPRFLRHCLTEFPDWLKTKRLIAKTVSNTKKTKKKQCLCIGTKSGYRVQSPVHCVACLHRQKYGPLNLKTKTKTKAN